MMYALFLANPDAFYHGNMNNLKGGVRLRVPTEEALFQLTDARCLAESGSSMSSGSNSGGNQQWRRPRSVPYSQR